MDPDERNPNETLLKMRELFKPRTKASADFDTPLKRRRSSREAPNGTSPDTATPPQKLLRSESSFDVSYVASPREARRLRADVLESRNFISSLENRIQHMHTVRKEMQIMFDSESRSLRQQVERDAKTVAELEARLQEKRRREIELNNELAQANYKCSTAKLEADRRIEELEKCVADLKKETVDASSHTKTETQLLQQQVKELEMLLEAAQSDAQAHKRLSAELDKRLSERTVTEATMQLKDKTIQKLQLELKELEQVKENCLEYQQQAKLQLHRVVAYADLERENHCLKNEVKRLRDEVCNKLLLEEEVHDLKGRLGSHKENEKKLVQLQALSVQVEMQLNEWKSVARGICESGSSDAVLPHMLRAVVERLQQHEIGLTADKVQLQSLLNTALHDAKLARADMDKHQKHAADLQTSVQQRQTLIHRIQKKLQLVSRERDSYRLQLDSYERDLTMSVSIAHSGASQTQRERIDELERIVAEYRDMVARLENDLQQAESAGNSSDAVPVRSEQTKRLQEELEQMRLQNAHLRDRKDQLEIQLEEFVAGQDSASARIVHLAKNPLSECIMERESANEKLKQEVERLKLKIHKMEQGLEGSRLADLTMNACDTNALKEQLKGAEAQNQRLKDYFKSSMQELRNVIYMLFGYKMDKGSNSQFTLISMYAESEHDEILFRLDPSGTLNLIENDYTAGLDEMIDLHLAQQKSIPMFLSAITINLFNNHTLPTTTYEIPDDDDDDEDEEEDNEEDEDDAAEEDDSDSDSD